MRKVHSAKKRCHERIKCEDIDTKKFEVKTGYEKITLKYSI